MFKNLLNTITTRFLTAVVTFIIVTISSRQLGAAGFGTISLLILNISIVAIVSGIIGSAGLVYLSPRHDLFKLFVISYIWSIISSIVVTTILYFSNQSEYFIHVLILSLITSFTAVNQSIILGKERIKKFNLVSLIQSLLLLFSLSILFFNFEKKDIESYIISLYIAYTASFIYSLICIAKDLKFTDFKNIDEIIKELFKFGFYNQSSYIIQLFNYRLSYLIINAFYGKSILGIFALGVQLSESIWIISKSLSTVQYARISNSDNLEYSKNITISFAKISFVFSFLCIVALMIIPENLFLLLFNKDFTGIKEVMGFLSVGILSISVVSIITHYFSGIGKPHLDTICSIVGLVFTLILGFVFIPTLGIIGAALTSTFSYLACVLVAMMIFMNLTKTSLKELIINKSDLNFFFAEIKNNFKNKKYA